LAQVKVGRIFPHIPIIRTPRPMSSHHVMMKAIVFISMQVMCTRALLITWDSAPDKIEEKNWNELDGFFLRHRCDPTFLTSLNIYKEARPLRNVWMESRGTNDTRHILYAFDIKTLPAAIQSVTSLAQHAADPSQHVIHWIVPEDDIHEISLTIDCLTHRMRKELSSSPQIRIQALQPHPFEGHCAAQPHLNDVRSTFARFYIPNYVPDAERVLYLDTDTIVKQDLDDVFRFPMKHSFGAVVQQHYKFNDVYGQLAIDKPNVDTHFDIFNDGVLLVDIPRWVEAGVTQRLEAWAPHISVFGDQIVLNLEANSGLGYDSLPFSFNQYNLACKCTSSNFQLPDGGAIDHWSCTPKPWAEGAAPTCVRAFQNYNMSEPLFLRDSKRC